MGATFGFSSPSQSMSIEQVRPVRLNLPLRSLRRCSRLHFALRKTPTTTRSFSQPTSVPGSQSINLASRHISDLGLRTHLPPDASPNPDDNSSHFEIPDQEWEIRTGGPLPIESRKATNSQLFL